MGLPPSGPKLASRSVIEVRELDIFELAAKANSSSARRAVLPMHRSSEDAIQEMVIALSRSAYLRPYQHLVPRSESFHVMQGLMTVVHFDDNGNVLRKIPMGTSSGRCVVYRHSEPIWHTRVCESPVVIYHRTMSGPLEEVKTVEYASWAPDEEDDFNGQRYLESLRHIIA